MAHQLRRQTQAQTQSAEIQIQTLREDLDAANKKIDRYVNLVATLSEELDNLRRGICYNCKNKLVPSFSPAASSSDIPHPSLWCHILSRQTPTPSSGPPPVFPPYARATLLSVHPVSTVQTLPKASISSPLQVSSITPRQPSTSPVDEIQSDQPDWTLAHNLEIKQSLHIDLVKTFNAMTKVFCVKFSPDGQYLAIGDESGKTYIYDMEKRLNICGLADYSPTVKPIIWDVQFSPDSQYVATAGSDGRIRVWDIARKRTIYMFRRPGSPVYSSSFSPGGRFLVSGDSSGSICKWRIRDGYNEILMPSGSFLCLSVRFSPNGRYIASAHFNGVLRIWDARTNHLLHRWVGPMEHAYCLAFTPDGNGLVSGGRDKTLKYWDVSSLVHSQPGQRPVVDGSNIEQILRFEGHTQLIRSVAVCPDNRWIVSSSRDRSLRFWDVHTATWQCTLQAQTGYVRAVDFSPAGQYLASGGHDCQVRLWRYRVA